MGTHHLRGMREGAMTLQERIANCLKLAKEADDLGICDAYTAELTGLLDQPLAKALDSYRDAYETGLSDRATLLKLEE